MGKKKFADKHVEEFQTAQPYDVQGFAFGYVQKEFRPSEEMLSKMKISAWNNGIQLT